MHLAESNIHIRMKFHLNQLKTASKTYVPNHRFSYLDSRTYGGEDAA
jgi:hypothetical protein